MEVSVRIIFVSIEEESAKFLFNKKNTDFELILVDYDAEAILRFVNQKASAIILINEHILIDDINLIKSLKNKKLPNPILYLAQKRDKLKLSLDILNAGASDVVFKEDIVQEVFYLKLQRLYEMISLPLTIIKLTEQIQTQNEEIQSQNEELNATIDELVLSNKELELKEKRWQSVINEAPWGMHFYEIDANGQLIFIGYNPSANKILKFDHQAIVGKSIEMAFPALTKTDVPKEYKEVALTGKVYFIEQIEYNENGIAGAFEVRAFQLEKNKMLAAFVDITSRKIQEEEMRQKNIKIQAQNEEIQSQIEELKSTTEELALTNKNLISKENFLKTIIDQAPFGMLFLELNQHDELILINANNASAKILEHSLINEFGKNLYNAFPFFKGSEVLSKFIMLAKFGSKTVNETLQIKLGFRTKILVFTAFQNETNKIVIVFTDETEVKGAEAAVRLSEKRLGEAQRIAKIASFERNLKTNEEYWSDEMFKLLGYQNTEIEISEAIFQKHIYPDDRLIVKKHMTELLAFKDTFSFEYRMLTKQNEVKHVFCSGNVIRNKNGHPLEVEGILQDITDRKEIEISLKHHETNLKVLFDSVEDLIVLLDNQYKIIVANKAFQKHFKREEYQILNNILDDFLPDNTRRLRRKHFDQAIQYKTTISFEDFSDGKYWSNTIYPVIENDQLVRIAFINKDISLLKNAELKERETAFLQSKMAEYAFALNSCRTYEETYELLGSHLSNIVKDSYLIVSSIDSKTEYAQVSKYFGFDTYLDKIINLIGQDPRKMMIHQSVYSKEEKELLYGSRLNLFSGGIYAYSARKIPLFICNAIEKLLSIKRIYTHGIVINKELKGVVAIFTKDKEAIVHQGYIEAIINQTCVVLNRLNAETMLMESEERYRNVVMNVGEGIGILDLQGNFLFANPATEIIFGENENSILGKNINQFLGTQQQAILLKEFENTQKNSKQSFELEILIDNNSKKILQVSATPHLNPMGQFAGTFNTFKDITLQKKNFELQQNLEIATHTTKIKQQFLANMSHEMRTPMNGIIGMTEFLNNTKLNDTQADYVRIISEQSKILLALINDVLELSRIEAGTIVLHQDIIDTKQFIKKIEDTFTNFTNQKKLGFSVYATKGFPNEFITDELRLFQVLSNLISNAIKFTKSGYVVVSFHFKAEQKEHNLLEIRVSDTGIGIKDDDKERIFEKFTQLDQSNTRVTEGSGLGLSITKSLVSLLGGEIDVESELGRGSAFWFTFKSSKNNLNNIKADEVPKPKISEKSFQLSILLVEDKYVNRKVAEIMLKNLDCTVDIAENGAIAVDLVGRKKYDLVFMDIQMPIMDGLTATQEIKKRLKNPPIIIGLSAEAMEGDAEKYISLGMDDYLTKPITTESIVNKLSYWKNKMNLK